MSFFPRGTNRRFLPGEGKRASNSATRLNQSIDASERIRRSLERQLGPIVIQWTITDIFLGQIISADTISETYDVAVDELIDARYWVARARVKGEFATDELVEVEEDDAFPPHDRFVTATNLAEVAAASHSMTEDGDDIVVVFGVTVDTTTGVPAEAYFFSHGGGGPPVFGIISATADKNGTYEAKTLTWDFSAFDPTASGTLTLSGHDTPVSTFDFYFINTVENGVVTPTHGLDVGNYVFGWQVDTFVNGDDEYPLILGFAMGPGVCS